MNLSFSNIKNINDFHHTNVVLGQEQSTKLLKSKLQEFGFKIQANVDFKEENLESFGIDEARDLSLWVSLKPIDNNPKIIIIISKVITIEAQNALLKTLEEPYPNVYFFFILPSTKTLLDTFLSRVFIYADEVDEKDPQTKLFLESSTKEKFEFIKKYAKKDEKQTLKNVAINIEKNIKKSIEQKETEKIKKILLAKKMALARGSSPKMILEWLSLYL